MPRRRTPKRDEAKNIWRASGKTKACLIYNSSAPLK
ncbi:phage terminase small subunit-related protein [Levilactobacillus sp. 244-2]